jgi:hypothetical protein
MLLINSEGFWRWCIVLERIRFLDFVHRPMFSQKHVSETVQVQWLKLALYKVPNRVGTIFILPEDGNRSSFRNVVFFRNIGRWTKSKNLILSMLFITWTLCQICLFEFIRVEGAWSLWNILRGAQAITFWEPFVWPKYILYFGVYCALFLKEHEVIVHNGVSARLLTHSVCMHAFCNRLTLLQCKYIASRVVTCNKFVVWEIHCLILVNRLFIL